MGFSGTLKVTRIHLLKGAWRAKTDRRLDLLSASVVSEVGSGAQKQGLLVEDNKGRS